MESIGAGLAVGTRVCLRGRVLGVLCVTLDREAFDAADRERLRRLAHGSAMMLAAEDRIRALADARDALVEEQADKARFVVRATQDLRDPLTVAKLGCQFFARIGKDSDLIPHLVLRIARSVDRIERMIDDLSAAAIVAAEGDQFADEGPRLRLVPGEGAEDPRP